MDKSLSEIRESALDYLGRLDAVLPELINEMRAADIRRFGMLADIAEGVKWLHDAAEAVSQPGDADRLADAFGALEEAITNRDYTLIADVLEYEIAELAADWRGALEGAE